MSDIQFTFEVDNSRATSALKSIDTSLMDVTKRAVGAESSLSNTFQRTTVQMKSLGSATQAAASRTQVMYAVTSSAAKTAIIDVEKLAAAQKKVGDAAGKKKADPKPKKSAKEDKGFLDGLKDGFAFGGAAALGMAAANALKDSIVGAFEFATNAVMEHSKQIGNLQAAFGMTKDQAKDFWNDLDALEDNSLNNMDDMIESYKRFGALGLSSRDATQVISAANDVAAKLGNASAGEGFQDIIAKLIAKNELDPKALKQLTSLGFNVGDLAEAFNVKGKVENFDQLSKALKKTKVDGYQATDALLNLVSTKVDGGGPLGTMAKKVADADLGKQLDNLKGNLAGLFHGINTEPLAAFVNKFNTFLNGDSGKKLQESIGRAFSAIGDAIMKINIDAVFTSMASFADWLATVDFVSGVKLFVDYLGYLASVVKLIFDVVTFNVGIVIDAFTGIYNAIVRIFNGDSLVSVGHDLVEGLWTGITGRFTQLKGDLVGTFGSIKDVAKDVLQINSPSKVMIGVGDSIGEGTEVGINRSIPGAVTSAAEMATRVSTAANSNVIQFSDYAQAQPTQTLQSMTTNNSSQNIPAINIIIEGGSDPKATALAVREELEALLFGAAVAQGAA